MALPADVTRHHTAWVSCAECAPHPVRYSIDGQRIVCFGDDLPAGAVDGRAVFVTVHEVAQGPAVARMTGVVHDLDVDDVDPNAVLGLLEHVSLGRTPEEVAASIRRHRTRRLVSVVEQ